MRWTCSRFRRFGWAARDPGRGPCPFDDAGLSRLSDRSGRSLARLACGCRERRRGLDRRFRTNQPRTAGGTGVIAFTCRVQPVVPAAGQLGSGRGADGRRKQYAAVVIPPRFTTALLTVAGAPTTAAGVSSKPTVELLTNPRAGTIGVGLATGVLQPALAHQRDGHPSASKTATGSR